MLLSLFNKFGTHKSFAAVFITALLLLKSAGNGKVEMLLNDEKKEHAVLLENSVNKLGEDLRSFTEDNSRWDDMLEFVKHPDKKWADINIGASFPTLNLQAAWIYDKNFILKYFKSSLGDKYVDYLPVKEKNFRAMLKSNAFCHFYTKTPEGILEICGAPVQPEKEFTRIHRSTIINLKYLDKIEPWFQRSLKVYLKETEKTFVVSKRYAAKLKEHFSI